LSRICYANRNLPSNQRLYGPEASVADTVFVVDAAVFVVDAAVDDIDAALDDISG